jgi:sugar (pentulose or hexulose) kinase
MTGAGWIVVLDVGKTLAKATLWNEACECVALRTRPNRRLEVDGIPTLDASGIEAWLEGILSEFALLGPVSGIVPVAHGAGAAHIHRGRLLRAPIDYEWSGIAQDRANYDPQRDSFEATGSPPLPAGLNLGMQLHWLESLRAGGHSRTDEHQYAQILPWAQYWAWLLSGVAASEVTSLGCHTDLWRPYDRSPSALAVRRGWAERLAPLARADTVLGEITPGWARRTGLSARVQIYCGLHDSNAALFAAREHPVIQGHDATVLSTGTWFVAMRSPLVSDHSHRAMLSESRDCLVNVDVTGASVPSARFMGGREISILVGEDPIPWQAGETEETWATAAIRAVELNRMILPGVVPGVGPFPRAKRESLEARPGDPGALALAHLYAALVSDVSLDLIGSCDTLLIDGRFSQAPVFVRALAALRPQSTVWVSRDDQGVARGALRLVHGAAAPSTLFERVSPLSADMTRYRALWRDAAAAENLR